MPRLKITIWLVCSLILAERLVGEGLVPSHL